MDIQLKKLELIEWIAQITDIDTLSQMDRIRKTYLSKRENIKPMSLDEFYSGIDKAEEVIKSGRVNSQKEVEKDSENW